MCVGSSYAWLLVIVIQHVSMPTYQCRWLQHPHGVRSCAFPNPGFCISSGSVQFHGSWHYPAEPGRFHSRSRSWCVRRQHYHNLSVGTPPGRCWRPSHHHTPFPSFPGSRSPPGPGKHSVHSPDGWCRHLNQERDRGFSKLFFNREILLVSLSSVYLPLSQ